jgi:hypothetical protein
MRCATCGEELREGARFCPTCGTPAAESAAQAARAPAPMHVERPVDPAAAARGAAPSVPAEQPAQRPPTASVPPPRRVARDPGAGYDPTGASPYGPNAGRAPTAPSAAGGAPTAVSGADFTVLFQRLGRLARLDTGVFAEIYADARATVPVAVFAAVVLLLSGLGGFMFIASAFGFDVYRRIASGSGEFFFRSMLLGTIFALAMVAAWSGITMLLLKQLARVNADFLGLARVFGVALVPLVLALLLFIDDFYLALALIALGGVATLALIGVLESLDVRPGHAWLATMAGFAAFVIVLVALGDGARDLAPGFFVGNTGKFNVNFDFNDLFR